MYCFLVYRYLDLVSDGTFSTKVYKTTVLLLTLSQAGLSLSRDAEHINMIVCDMETEVSAIDKHLLVLVCAARTTIVGCVNHPLSCCLCLFS